VKRFARAFGIPQAEGSRALRALRPISLTTCATANWPHIRRRSARAIGQSNVNTTELLIVGEARARGWWCKKKRM